jgi:1-acyl-sn-glycerol-3-phosphate acyltransferase
MTVAEGIRCERRGLSQTGGWGFWSALLMNLWVYPGLVLLTLFFIAFFPFLFPLTKRLTRWDTGRVVRFFIWCYGRGWIALCSPFVRFSREGFERVTIPRPCIFVVNHLSFFDIYCMALLPMSDAVFAVRSWPFKLFWYAPFMRLAEYLDLETIGWEGTLSAGKRILSRKSNLLFYPEGHRSRTGRLNRFHSGPFRLAVETGVPVVPLCLSGTEVLLPPGKWWMKPAAVRLAVLPPVDPRHFEGPLAHLELKKQVKGLMAEKLTEMRGHHGR